jgi:hypothetical protein
MGCGWNVLIVPTSGPEEVAKFTMFTTEAIRGFKAFEAAHTSDPTLGAPMVLLKTIIEVGRRWCGVGPSGPGSCGLPSGKSRARLWSPHRR